MNSSESPGRKNPTSIPDRRRRPRRCPRGRRRRSGSSGRGGSQRPALVRAFGRGYRQRQGVRYAAGSIPPQPRPSARWRGPGSGTAPADATPGRCRPPAAPGRTPPGPPRGAGRRTRRWPTWGSHGPRAPSSTRCARRPPVARRAAGRIPGGKARPRRPAERWCRGSGCRRPASPPTRSTRASTNHACPRSGRARRWRRARCARRPPARRRAPGRHLVAGRARGVQVGSAIGLPLEVEPERHPVTDRPAVRVVHGGWVVEPQGEGLAAERDVVERRLDVVVGPQALGADLERRRPGRGDVVVDHRHQRPTVAHHAGPIPGDPSDWDRGRDARSRRARRRGGEVEVPRLAPPVAVPGGVVGLVGGGQPHGREIGHSASLSRYARTLWRLPQTFMEHQRRERLRDSS